MSEKSFSARVIHKHDTEENWNKVTNFIPKQAEIIVYDIDEQNTYERMKIGDGKTIVKDLPFVNILTEEQLANINAIPDKVDKEEGYGLSKIRELQYDGYLEDDEFSIKEFVFNTLNEGYVGGSFYDASSIRKLLAYKQDTLESGTNIKTINGESVLGKGDIKIAGEGSGTHPTDAVIWKEPQNFGLKVDGVIGDNIKVYRDVYDETLVFVGSGAMYNGTAYNDKNLIERVCGANNTTVRKIIIQDGITSIGHHVLNRFFACSKAFNVKSRNNNKFTDVGNTVHPIILPKSVSYIGLRAFQYNTMAHTIIINCDSDLILHNDSFESCYAETIQIPNATSISGYNQLTFQIPGLKNFSIGNDNCLFNTSVSFGSNALMTDTSLINIANHLKTIEEGDTVQTLTLHATAKTLCDNTKGDITDGKFVKNTSGTVTLTDFITNTKGWTLA